MAGGEDRKAALIAELARTRAQIGGAAVDLHAQLDVGAKVQRAVTRYRWWLLGGAVFFGVALTKLPARTKKVYVNEKGRPLRDSPVAQTGLALAAAKFAFDFAKPMLVKWASRQVAEYVRKRAAREAERV